jgi:hypothetical protein
VVRIAQIGTHHGHAACKWRALTSTRMLKRTVFEPDASLRGRTEFPQTRRFSL